VQFASNARTARFIQALRFINQLKEIDMRLRNIYGTVVVAGLLLPLASFAQSAASGDSDNAPSAGQVQQTPSASAGSSRDSAAFDRMDLDEDGFITREEAAGTSLADRFDQLDTDHDGKLSPSEVNAGSASASSGASVSGEAPSGYSDE
jgi:EF hand